MNRVLVLATLLAYCGYAGSITVMSDAAGDFSRTENPNGVWQYGYSRMLGSFFVQSTDPGVREGVDTWRGNLAGDGNPAAYHNATGVPIVIGRTARFETDQFGLHPGPRGEYAVLRYVAPQAGLASIASVFTVQDVVGTTTDVHVLANGRSLFDGLVEGDVGSAVPFAANLPVLAADQIDFAVGFGRNGSFSFDTTGLAVTITLRVVPEPSSLLLLLLPFTAIVLSSSLRVPRPAQPRPRSAGSG